MEVGLLLLLVLSPASLLASPIFLNGNNGGSGVIGGFLLNTGSAVFCTNAADNQGCQTCMANGGFLNFLSPAPYMNNMANCIRQFFGSQYGSCADVLTPSSQVIFGGNMLDIGQAIACVLIPRGGGSVIVTTTTSTTTQATTTQGTP
ncbi:unnamed protein product [Darwinula stevensoni]|uniref:Uncharacterized protein n=1 Tax=Darwinula stevensoni TaxID=69355 RepID=A0A7R8XKA9_9CRUS|nr:unnamed protein product [Darwinula stevensoni]CAG0895033.1 unnamed protein product [Darwinula stevensoni]